MTAKLRQLTPQERARVERRLRAENDSRTMRLDVSRTILSRISRAEENELADRARRDQRETDDGEAAAILANMARELERVRPLIPGDRRGYFREIEHGLEGLERAVS